MFYSNTAKFPKQLRTETALYKKHNSYPYNPIIANVFFRAGFIESWGRGFEKILNGIKINKGPRPSYEINDGGVMVLYVAQNEYMKLLHNKKQEDTTQENYPRKLLEKSNGNRIEKLIIDIIKNKPNITINEIAEKMGFTRDGIKYHINKLKRDNRIKHVGSTKAGYWVIK